MALSDALKKKMAQSFGAAPDEEESEMSSEGESESESPSDSPFMKGGKPNPLRMWAKKDEAGGNTGGY